MDTQVLKKFYIVNDKKDTLYTWDSSTYTSKEAFDASISNLQEQIASLSAGGLTKKIVSTLPPIEEAQVNVIYLVPDPKSMSGAYIEYLCFVDPSGEKQLEPIGSTETDLADYLKSSDAADIYLSKTEAASTYATAVSVNQTVESINGELTNKANTFSLTQAAFDQAKADNALQDKSFYVVKPNA